MSHIQANTFNESSAENENVLTNLKQETGLKIIEEAACFGSEFKILEAVWLNIVGQEIQTSKWV